MAEAVSAWKTVLEAAKIPANVAEHLAQAGYETMESFQFVDETTFKAFAQHLLLTALKTEGVTDTTWSFHPLVGKLRGLWKKALDTAARCVAVAVPSHAGAAGVASAGACRAKNLNVLDRGVMRRALETKSSRILVTVATLPSMPLLNSIKAQQDSKAFDCVPWRKLLSEKGATSVKDRKGEQAKDKRLEVLGISYGLADERWDREISGAPFHVEQLLQLRANAYAMVGAWHLGSWPLYITRFLEDYTKIPGSIFVSSRLRRQKKRTNMLCARFLRSATPEHPR